MSWCQRLRARQVSERLCRADQRTWADAKRRLPKWGGAALYHGLVRRDDVLAGMALPTADSAEPVRSRPDESIELSPMGEYSRQASGYLYG